MTEPDVLALLAEANGGYRGLYYRWERQQWEAGKLDLSVDVGQWPTLDPSLRLEVTQAVGWRHLRARLALDALVGFADAAPHEEQQVFLATQLADEARHIVLFDRFGTDVMGMHPESIDRRRPDVVDEDLRALLLDVLVETSAAVAAAPEPDLDALSEAVTIYQIGIVGMLGLTQQRSLIEELEPEDLLPGLRRGLTLAGRDASRHVAFALLLLQEATAADGGALARSHEALRTVAPLILRVLSGSGDVGGAQKDLARAAGDTCVAWFQAVGLEPPALG